MRQRVARGLAWIGASQVMLQLIRTGARDLRRPPADAVGVRPGDARAGVREPRARLLRPRARRGAGAAQEALGARPQHRVLDHGRQRRRCSRSSAWRSRARWPPSTASPTSEPLLAVLSRQLHPHRARRDAAVAAAARDGLPPARDADGRRRAGRRGRGGRRSPPLAPGPWAIIGQQLATAVVTSALMWRASSWRPQLDLLAREPARPRRLQRLPGGAPPAVLPPPERRPLPHRPLHRHRRARRLRRRLQRDARPGGADRRAAAAGAGPGLLAHAGRAGADRRGVGARDAARRRRS